MRPGGLLTRYASPETGRSQVNPFFMGDRKMNRDELIDSLRERVAELEAELAGIKGGCAVKPIRFWFIGDSGQKKGATFCKKSSRDGSLAFFETEEDALGAAKRHAGTAVYSVDYYKSAILLIPERSNERGSDGELTYEAAAHNRCLDAVARLNAPLFSR